MPISSSEFKRKDILLFLGNERKDDTSSTYLSSAFIQILAIETCAFLPALNTNTAARYTDALGDFKNTYSSHFLQKNIDRYKLENSFQFSFDGVPPSKQLESIIKKKNSRGSEETISSNVKNIIYSNLYMHSPSKLKAATKTGASSSSSNPSSISYHEKYQINIKGNIIEVPTCQFFGCSSSTEGDKYYYFSTSFEGAQIVSGLAESALNIINNNDDSDNSGCLFTQKIIKKIEILNSYIPSTYKINPDYNFSIATYPNLFKFPLIILLNCLENCLNLTLQRPFSLNTVDYVFLTDVENKELKYVRQRLFYIVKLFASGIANIVRKRYKNLELANKVEHEVNLFLLENVRFNSESAITNNDDSEKNGIMKFIDHSINCDRHSSVLIGSLFESLFSPSTCDYLLLLIRDKEFKILVENNYIFNFRRRVGNEETVSSTSYWWEPFGKNNTDEKLIVSEYLTNDRKISFENIKFVSRDVFPSFSYLWGGLFITASENFYVDNPYCKERDRRIHSKTLLCEFMTKHVYMMTGCPQCEENYPEKLKSAFTMSILLWDNQTAYDNANEKETFTTSLYALSIQLPFFRKILSPKTFYPNCVYIYRFLNFMMLGEDEDDDEKKFTKEEYFAVDLFSCYTIFLLLNLGDPEYFNEMVMNRKSDEKKKSVSSFDTFQKYCHVVALWLLRNLIGFQKQNVAYKLENIIPRMEIVKFGNDFSNILIDVFDTQKFHIDLKGKKFDKLCSFLNTKFQKSKVVKNNRKAAAAAAAPLRDGRLNKKMISSTTKIPLMSNHQNENELLEADTIPFFIGEMKDH